MDRRPDDRRPTLAQRPGAMTRAAFVAAYGGIYEHSPWIAEALFAQGLGSAQDTADGLHAAMAAIVDSAPHDRRLALLRAHPDLAGRLAIRGELTAHSSAEQASAGLDSCSPDEHARFSGLNDAYRRKFGFPFIMAVKGRQRAEILAAFETRLANSPEAEFRTALAQVHKIALLRLRAL